MSRYHHLLLSSVVVLSSASAAFGFQDESREWSDSTGKFKVSATLIEVKDDSVFLRAANGKTLKIPIARLSKADKEFLEGGDSPFEVIEESDDAMAAPSSTSAPASRTSSGSGSAVSSSESPASSGSSGGYQWKGAWSVDWDNVTELDRGFGEDGEIKWPSSEGLGFEARRANLPKKSNFFEDLRTMSVNPVAKRAVVGYTVSFSVPSPQSRVSLIDMMSGKTVTCKPVDATNMCAYAVLNDGSTIVMKGTGEDPKHGVPSQLQLWKLNGNNVYRSDFWIPFPNDSESWGKRTDAEIAHVQPLPNDKLLVLATNGHLACFDARTREPLWHSRLSGNYAIDVTKDQSLVVLLDGHSIMAVDPQEGVVKRTYPFGDQTHMAWPRIALGPTGKKLLVTFTQEIRLLNLESGEWELKTNMEGQVANYFNGPLNYPHEEYALLNQSLLVHLPTMINVCAYHDAKSIRTIAGTSFVGVMAEAGGLFVPTTFPHKTAIETLEKAKSSPETFLVHPGVEVAVNVSSVSGEHRQEIETALKKAAETAGYKVVANSPISINANVEGPKTEAVAYIASGSYVVNKYISKVSMEWQGKTLWAQSGDNVPGFVQTKEDETIQDVLDRAGKGPSMWVFQNARFPKLLQRPAENQGPNSANAIVTSKFTTQGLVDSN